MSGTTVNAYHRRKTEQLGNLIRELRETRDWSPPRLADEAGVSANAIRNIEKNRVMCPSLIIVVKVAGAFGFKASDLLDEVGL